MEFFFGTSEEARNFWRTSIDHHTFFRCPSAERARQLAQQMQTEQADMQGGDGIGVDGNSTIGTQMGATAALPPTVPSAPKKHNTCETTLCAEKASRGTSCIPVPLASTGAFISASLPAFSSLLSAKSAAAAQYVYVGRTQKELIEHVRENFSKRTPFQRMYLFSSLLFHSFSILLAAT